MAPSFEALTFAKGAWRGDRLGRKGLCRGLRKNHVCSCACEGLGWKDVYCNDLRAGRANETHEKSATASEREVNVGLGRKAGREIPDRALEREDGPSWRTETQPARPTAVMRGLLGAWCHGARR